MKKVISIVLTLSLILSLFSCFSLVSSAEETTSTEQETVNASYVETTVDFDSNSQPTFYAQNGGYENFDAATLEDEHNNVAKFTKISTVAKDKVYGEESPRTFAISNNAGTEYKQFQSLDQLKFSVDVKLEFLKDASHDLYIGMIFSSNAVTKVCGNDYNKGETVYKYYNSSNPQFIEIGQVDTTNNGEESTWQTITGTATVPVHKNEEIPYLILYSKTNEGYQNEITIYIDNVVIGEPVLYEQETVIDFESEGQREFYSQKTEYYMNYNDGNALPAEQTGDDGHGYTSKFTKVSSDNRVYGTVDPRALALCDSSGTRSLSFTPDVKLNVSVDIKGGFGACKDIYAALVFDDYKISAIGGRTRNTDESYDGGINAIISDRKLVDIGAIDLNNSDWQTVSGTITVPAHDPSDRPVLILYSKTATSYINGLEIYVDNITVKTLDSNIVTFDSISQNDWYNTPNTAYETESGYETLYRHHNTSLVQTYSTNGNAVLLTRLGHNYAIDRYATMAHAIALPIEAEAGRMNLQSGTKYNISVDINVANCNEDVEKFSVGIAFTNNRITFVGSYYENTTTDCGLQKLAKNGKLRKIADVNAKKSGWQTLSGTITVPEHEANEYPVIVIYQEWTNKGYTDQEIYLDNVAIAPVYAELPEKPVFADVTENGSTDVLDLIRLKKNIDGDYKELYDLTLDTVLGAEDLVVLKRILIGG